MDEKKDLLEEVRQNELRYHNLFQHSNAVMLIIDPDTAEIVDANLAACNFYQYNRDELLRKKITDINTLSEDAVFKEMERARQEKRNYFNFEHRLANGKIRPVEVFSSPIEIGERQLLYSIIHDITERRNAEEALRQSEGKYRTILETMSEGYLENDLAGNFLFANDSSCNMLGYLKEEITKLNYRQIVSEETAEKMFAVYKQIYLTGKPETLLDFEIIRRDREKLHLELNIMLMRDDTGTPIGYRVVSRDVTLRREAEEALRRSEEKYRSILENITEGYFESDLNGGIVFVNEAATIMMGYDRETLCKINYRQFTTPETKKRFQEIYRDVLEKGTYSTIDDFEIIRGDGSIRIHQMTVALIRNEAGNPTGFRTVARDITEQKRADQALRQSEERIRLLFNNIPVPTFVWKAQDGDFVLSEYNSSALQFIGNRIIHFVGKTADRLFTHIPEIPLDIRKCLILHKTVENQFWYSQNDRAEDRYIMVKYAWAPPDSVLMHINDITAQKQAEINLQYISIHDSLTGLFNRFYADAEINRLAVGRSRPVSVVMIDLNGLKKVNDESGHAMGDLYIKNVAAVLKQTFRPEDVIARIGGDEFIILLPLVNEDVCIQAMNRLQDNVKRFNEYNSQQMSIAAGSATTHRGDNLLEIIREADSRMYREKALIKAAQAAAVNS